MNILLMSIKAGYGHHSTAKAIIEKFEANGHICQMLDIFEYISPYLGNAVQDGYLLSSKYLSSTYGKVYNVMAEKETPYGKFSFPEILSTIVSKKLRTYVEEFNPDLIIGTHSYAGMIMGELKQKEIALCPMIGIVTDFTVHPFWESTSLDYYVIPDRGLIYEMERKGIPKEKVLPFGIPIRSSFESCTDKHTARCELGIDDKKTILVMMGSMGYGNIKKTLIEIDETDEDFQVLCICGNNERMQKAVNKYPFKKKVFAYGFTDKINIMMDATDIIISKPGGLTTSEALAKGVAMIAVNPIPGQEDRNLMYLLNNAAVIAVNDTYRMSDALHQLLGIPERLEELKAFAKRLGKPKSTDDLYQFCEENFFKKAGEIENSLPLK